jgi:hypothetical protein
MSVQKNQSLVERKACLTGVSLISIVANTRWRQVGTLVPTGRRATSIAFAPGADPRKP